MASVGLALLLLRFHVEALTVVPTNPVFEKPEDNPALDGWTEVDGYLTRIGDRESVHFGTPEVCTDANNKVLPRYDGTNQDLGVRRKYSITKSSFSGVNGQRDCDSVDALLKALRAGQRKWAEGVANENKTSVFLPRGCNIPHHSSDDLQVLVSQNVSTVIDGDSLTRHMLLGLSTLWMDNYYDGVISHQTKTDASGKQHLWQDCTCDGQFSEALYCRSIGWMTVAKRRLAKQECSGPRIFWLQGGAHYGSKATLALEKYFLPLIHDIKKQHGCGKGLYIFVSGINTQSRSLDAKYPHQSRENASIFNQAIADRLKHESVVTMVDFMSLTADAPTSDGYHYLSDVNIVKADVFVALVRLIQKEWEATHA